MRKGGGKAKGSQFEREVCVWLSRWVTNDKQEDVFWRSAMSGGRATVSSKRTGKRLAAQVGDISCIHPAGFLLSENFAIECKFYADLNYTGLLTNKGKLLDFWLEIKTQAESVSKKPMLFARQNRLPIFVCLDKAGLATLGLRPDESVLINPRHNLHIVHAGHFFANCKPFTNGEPKWN